MVMGRLALSPRLSLSLLLPLSTHTLNLPAMLRQHPYLPSLPSLLNLVFLIIGTLTYRLLERWPWVDCAYAAVGVLTTVGIVVPPKTRRGLLFTAVLNVCSMGAAGLWINELFEQRKGAVRRLLRIGGDAPAASRAGRLLREALLLCALAVPPWLGAAAGLCALEGWPWSEGLLFTLTCSTGLGMGELEPHGAGAKALLSAYLFYSMGTWLQLTHVGGLLFVEAFRGFGGGGAGGGGGGGASAAEKEEDR